MLYITTPLDENLIVSETHQVVQRNYFDSNELLQECTIILFVSFFFSFVLE